MRRTVVFLMFAATVFGGAQWIAGQAGAGPSEPFKVGTFERGGRAFVGVALRDTQIIDLTQANAALEGRNTSQCRAPSPGRVSRLASISLTT